MNEHEPITKSLTASAMSLLLPFVLTAAPLSYSSISQKIRKNKSNSIDVQGDYSVDLTIDSGQLNLDEGYNKFDNLVKLAKYIAEESEEGDPQIVQIIEENFLDLL